MNHFSLYHSILLKMGAYVSESLNKDCNVMIWYDGSIISDFFIFQDEQIESFINAINYKIKIVTPYWIKACISNKIIAPFDEYKT